MESLRKYLALLLVAAFTANAAGCANFATTANALSAADLMEGLSPNGVTGRPLDDTFTASMADFSVDLFKRSVTDKENALLSPLSVMLALAMTANGADGDTLTQMEATLGGGIPLAKLNEYLYEYARKLPSTEKSKLKVANSLWFRDDGDSLQVQADFLQKNADYFGAEAYSAAFDSQTVKDINNWVKSNTDGMIDAILSEINSLDLLFLINAVVFDAEWQNVYFAEDVRKSDFTNMDGAIRNVDFMYSSEYSYLDDGRATGFLKPYANDSYSFAALLPNEGISIREYIESLTGEGFLDTLRRKQDVLVFTSMPKFSYNYTISLIETLRALGIRDAFDETIADFGSMAATTLGNGNIYISQVLHKTFIAVDELGTKAGAVTMVAAASGGTMPVEPKIVNLDRPFVYAIIDNATNLPVFIGALMSL
ncbi:MAG: serpin family protein [Clostridiales bacterium]|nr:serpin family protein [Clostridiales bacterium]